MSDNSSEKKLKVLETLSLTDYCYYKNEIDLVDKILSVYSITGKSKKDQLRKFEKDVLNYYMRFGYSTETKRLIEEELGKSPDSITQATFFLTRKGYLEQSKTNFSKKRLSKDLLRFRDGFISGNKKMLILGFKRK